jgi:hypothetical protein
LNPAQITNLKITSTALFTVNLSGNLIITNLNSTANFVTTIAVPENLTLSVKGTVIGNTGVGNLVFGGADGSVIFDNVTVGAIGFTVNTGSITFDDLIVGGSAQTIALGSDATINGLTRTNDTGKASITIAQDKSLTLNAEIVGSATNTNLEFRQAGTGAKIILTNSSVLDSVSIVQVDTYNKFVVILNSGASIVPTADKLTVISDTGANQIVVFEVQQATAALAGAQFKLFAGAANNASAGSVTKFSRIVGGVAQTLAADAANNYFISIDNGTTIADLEDLN